MAQKPPPQESPQARAIVFALAAVIPVWAHSRSHWYKPLVGGWALLALGELGLLVGIALLLKAAARGEKRYGGLTFEMPFVIELFMGGLGAVIFGFTLYATSIIGAYDLSYGDPPKPTEISVPSAVAAIFFLLVSGAMVLLRPVFELNDSGARCTLFGTGLPVVLNFPRSELEAVAHEKPLIDNMRRIIGSVIHIRGKAGWLTFSLPRDAGIPTFLGMKELGQKDEVLAAWRARLKGPP